MAHVDVVGFALAWSPILLIGVLAVGFKRPALELSLWGTTLTVLLAVTYFRTAPWAVVLAAFDGILTNLPLLLLVYFGVLLSVVLTASGSLARLVAWLLGEESEHWHRALLLSVGIGNVLEGAGVVAEPVAAPMLHESGLSGESSTILSIQGYAGIMALSVAGALLLVLEAVTGLPVQATARASAWVSLPCLLFMVLTIPLVTSPRGGALRRWPLFLLTAVVAGVVSVVCTYWVGFSVAGLLAGLAVTVTLLGVSRHLPRVSRRILRDMAPFGFLVLALGLVNLVPALRTLTYERLVFTVSPVPVHPIVMRPLFSSYLYLLLAGLLSLRLFRLRGAQARALLREGTRKAGLTVIAMAIFGVMGQVVTFSGYDASFAAVAPQGNMTSLLANGLVEMTGSAYPLFAPLLGWIGTFLTGYGLAAIVLFAPLQLEAASVLGISPIVLVAALLVGSGVASISSPLKLSMAAALVGAAGKEGAMLRRTIPLGLVAGFLAGGAALLLRHWVF